MYFEGKSTSLLSELNRNNPPNTTWQLQIYKLLETDYGKLSLNT